MLDAKQLRYFVAVTEERHFTRAANRLFVTQSALSVQISNLEERLGARLLNRSKRSAVTLTVAGELFLPEARQALEQIDHAENVGRRAGRGEIGHVQIGYVASAAFSGVLPATVRAFKRAFPDVTIKLEEIATPRQLIALSNNQIDVGFFRPRPEYPDGVETRIIHSERLCVALPANHAAAGSRSIGAKRLMTETIIVPQFQEDPGFSREIEKMLGPDTATRSIMSTRDFLTAITLVSAGYGVAVVPDSLRTLALDGVVYVPLHRDASTVDLALGYRSDETSEAVLSLIKQIGGDST